MPGGERKCWIWRHFKVESTDPHDHLDVEGKGEKDFNESKVSS